MSATRFIILGLGLLFLCGCAQARIQDPGPGDRAAGLEADRLIAGDAYELPLSHWRPEGEARGIVLALHGFNDFRQSHEPVGQALRDAGFAVYAYDQRGFGATRERGIWPGEERLVDDAVLALSLLRERYPDRPLYLLGESMGAAVSLLAATRDERPEIQGLLLMAPAVWAREAQPWYQRTGLWLGLHVMPGLRVSSDWVAVEPTDDPEWADYWDEHPLVLHRSRLDTLVGLSDLMSQALAVIPELSQPALILYGGEDEVVPPEAICDMLWRLPESPPASQRFVYYPQGWHFLARDSRAGETLADMLAWLTQPEAPLPSGRELGKDEALPHLCNGNR